MNRIHDTGTALIEAEVHLAELATGPKAGRPDYVGFLSSADAVALRDELAALRTRLAVSTSAAPTGAAAPTREYKCLCGLSWLHEIPAPHCTAQHHYAASPAGRVPAYRSDPPGGTSCVMDQAAGRAPAEPLCPDCGTEGEPVGDGRFTCPNSDCARLDPIPARPAGRAPTRDDSVLVGHHIDCAFVRAWLRSETADCNCAAARAGRAPARAGTTPQHEQNQGETTNDQRREPEPKGESPMPKTSTAVRYDVEAQERVVSALWQFARALGHTEKDCDTTKLIHDGVAPALTEIMDAFGHGITSIE